MSLEGLSEISFTCKWTDTFTDPVNREGKMEVSVSSLSVQCQRVQERSGDGNYAKAHQCRPLFQQAAGQGYSVIPLSHMNEYNKPNVRKLVS